MNLSELKKALKTVGLQNISMSDGGYGIAAKHVKFKNLMTGKMIQGIRGGSRGPITSTMAHITHNKEKEIKVRTLLLELGCTVITDETGAFEATFAQTEKKSKTIRFWWDTYPTYTNKANLDSMYETYWLTLREK